MNKAAEAQEGEANTVETQVAAAAKAAEETEMEMLACPLEVTKSSTAGGLVQKAGVKFVFKVSDVVGMHSCQTYHLFGRTRFPEMSPPSN